jgi:AcrR family transcriptional regulator
MPDDLNRPYTAWAAPLSDRRSEIVLRAAFEVFAERGVHGATMSDVAARAGASKETLYARYENKEQLFQAVLAWSARELTAELAPFETTLSCDLPIVEEFACAVARCAAQPRMLTLLRLAIAEAERHPEIAKAFADLFRAPGEAVLRHLAGGLDAQKRARIADSGEFTAMFMGAVRDGLAQDLLLQGPAPAPEEIERRVRARVRRLMRAYGATSQRARAGAAN